MTDECLNRSPFQRGQMLGTGVFQLAGTAAIGYGALRGVAGALTREALGEAIGSRPIVERTIGGDLSYADREELFDAFEGKYGVDQT